MRYRVAGGATVIGLTLLGLLAAAGAVDPQGETGKKSEDDDCRRAVELTVQAVKMGDSGAESAEEERLYSEAIGACGTLPEARYNRALLYRRQGKRERALDDLGKALELRDDDRFRVARGRIFGELKQYDEARADFTAVLNRAPTEAGALIGLATVVEAQGDRAQAIHLLERGREAEPTSSVIRFNLGVLYELSGRIADADGEYDRATELDPLNGEAWYRRGVLLSARGEGDKAIAAFERAISAGGESEIPARSSLARFLRERKAFEKAELVLRRGLERSRDSQQLQRELAGILFEQERFEQVVETAGGALVAEPRQPYLLLLKGASERRLGRLEAAERSLTEAAQLESKNPVIHRELAHLFRALGRSEESSRHALVSKELEQSSLVPRE